MLHFCEEVTDSIMSWFYFPEHNKIRKIIDARVYWMSQVIEGKIMVLFRRWLSVDLGYGINWTAMGNIFTSCKVDLLWFTYY